MLPIVHHTTALANDGVIQASNVAATNAFYNAGWGYVAGKPLASTAAVAASDVLMGGFRFSATGILRLVNATAGLPAGTVINQGVAVTAEGQVCYSQTATAIAGSFHLNGVAVLPDGRVNMNLV